MKLLELTMSNFLSFGPEEKIDLSEIGLFLICGNNGSGKSAILDGLSFALYGYPVRNINLPKLVNEQNECNCKVVLKCDIGGAIYWVERYRKHEKHKDALRIYKNTYDEAGLISKADSKDAQEQLDGLIHLNYKAFINTIMLTQEEISGFIESTPAKKKEIIESILQLDTFAKYHKIAQDKRKLKKKALDIISVDIKTNEKLIENVKKTMEDYVDSCKRQKTKDKATLAELNQKLSDLQEINVDLEYEKIKKAQENELLRVQVESKKSIVANKIKSLKSELRTATQSKNEHESFVTASKSRIKKHADDLVSLDKQKQSIKAKIDDAKQNPEKCPFCNGVINSDLHEKYIRENEDKIAAIDISIVENTNHIKSENDTASEWSKKIDELVASMKTISAQIQNEEATLRQHDEEIKGIEDIIVMDEDEIKNIASQIIDIESKISAITNKEYIDRNYIASSKAKLIEITADLVKLQEDYGKQNIELTLMQFWEDSLSSKKNSIKSWCINNIIGYFNARIKSYIDRFFEGRISIQFDNELNEVVKFKKYERDFKQFSGGQRRRLNIAILFALNSLVKANVSNKIDILFLDEVLSNYLDDKGISIVLELLEEMKDNNESVWVIDHRDNFKNFPSFKKIDVWMDKKEFSHIKVN